MFLCALQLERVYKLVADDGCLICCIVLANDIQAIGFCILDVPNLALPVLYLRLIFLETAQTALFEERNMEMFSS